VLFKKGPRFRRQLIPTEVKPVLQTLSPNETYRSGELAFDQDHGKSLDFSHYFDLLWRRIFYFLLPFGLISVVGLYIAATKKPSYFSAGKILVETQRIAPDLVRPIVTATASERIQLIEQRILTRDNLASIARKFGLFPNLSRAPELMLASVQIKPVAAEGQPRPGASAIAFTVGFEHENPELAMRVANEFITLIVDEDARSRTSRATEAVAILTGETRDIEDKLESTQTQLLAVARRPRDSVAETPEKEKSQLTALAALKAELIQKASVYSEAHPTVTALKKRIAAMEKSLTQSPSAPEKARSTQDEEIEALKRQREVLEKRLADANAKLAVARLGEKLDRDQQSERLQVIESPPLPQYPEKSGRLKVVGIAFALAAALGIGAVMATELLDGSIRSRHQLSGVVDSHLVVLIPYITTPSDVIRARLRKAIVALVVVTMLTIWSGLMAAIVFHVPIDFSWSDKMPAFFGGTQR
jgi:uncharacterized protein involved in exopolysaccharide biosynthesis